MIGVVDSASVPVLLKAFWRLMCHSQGIGVAGSCKPHTPGAYQGVRSGLGTWAFHLARARASGASLCSSRCCVRFTRRTMINEAEPVEERVMHHATVGEDAMRVSGPQHRAFQIADHDENGVGGYDQYSTEQQVSCQGDARNIDPHIRPIVDTLASLLL